VRIVLKLGGALITDKRKGVFDFAKYDAINRIAKEISEAKQAEDFELLLVHGAGSFGHPYVEKYDLLNNPTPVGVAETHLACERLCEIVCKALIDNGVSAAPVHPFTTFKVCNGKIVFDCSVFRTLLKDFVPVTHGDVVPIDDRWGVLSGDDIAIELAEKFGAERLGFASNTVVIKSGRALKKISISSVREDLTSFTVGQDVSDVTGGMASKLLKVGKIAGKVEVFIFSGLKTGEVLTFLNGKDVGTKVLP
jgi:isopentenyl phosphate kinase